VGIALEERNSLFEETVVPFTLVWKHRRHLVFSVPFLVYCYQMHQHSIFWGSFVFGTKAPTFMVWPWLASLLHLFRNGELCGCVLLIPQAEVEHIWRRKVLLSRSF